jgi:protein-tyrosine phosphatase
LVRRASNIWFALIAFSAVLTYQHHVLDVVAGFALGVYCLYFFPEKTVRIPANSNPRIAVYYVVGTLSVVALAVLFWPWGAFLLWPAISLAVVAAGYLGAGPSIFRKRNGRLPWPTFWALGPVLLGQELSRCHYRRKCEAWNELTPRVWIGGVLNQSEAAAAVRNGVTAVLDLTAEFSEALPFLGVAYRNIPALDLTAPTVAQLEEMAAFIEEQAVQGIVYVHCKIGYSRTVTAAAAYLLRSGIAPSVEEALDLICGARPAVVIRPEVQAALDEFEKALGTSASTSQ